MKDVDKAPAAPGGAGRLRWRTPALAAAAVVFVGLVTVLVIQNRGGDGGTASSRDPAVSEHGASAPGCDPASSALPTLGPSTVSAVKSYGSVGELAADSTNIVVAEPTGERGEVSRPEWADNPAAPAVPSPTVQLAVIRVVGGEDIAESAVIDVIQPGTDTDGRPVLTAAARYLLFLAPFTYGSAPDGTVTDVDTYVTLGVVAGIFAQPLCETGPEFQRLDRESTGLPGVIDVDELAVTPGWTDATYLDPVAAVQPPELPDRSPVSDEVTPEAPARPFDCGAGVATNEVMIDDYVRAGIGAGTFCARIEGGDAGTATPPAEVPLDVASPLRALVRTNGGPFEAVAAGFVDASVTRVVAIRGDVDADNQADLLKDDNLKLYEMGQDGSAFLVSDTSYTVALVLYAGGVQVARAPLPVTELTEDPDGTEMYELRTDIVSPRDMPWAGWRLVDKSTVRLYFAGGPAACYAAMVTVQADDAAEMIGLQIGMKPEIEGCSDNLVAAAVDVPLGEPLDGRAVEPLLPQ